MKEFLEYTKDRELSEKNEYYLDIRYKDYCRILEAIETGEDIEMITEGFVDFFKGTAKRLKDALVAFKAELTAISEEMGIAIRDLIQAFKSRDIWAALKLFGFKLKLMLKTIKAAADLWRDGLFAAFHEMAESKVFEKYDKGLIKLDEIVQKWPLMKRVTGLMVAGLLFYIWLNMTFIGHLDYDFNFSKMSKALAGGFSLKGIFGGSSGAILATLFVTGAFVSVPWLGSTIANLFLAVTYTAVAAYQNRDGPLAMKLKSKLQFVKLKLKK